MFTGLIRHLGSFREYRKNRTELVIEAPENLTVILQPGESLAVDGVCLTLVTKEKKRLSFDLSIETSEKTTLGHLTAGKILNLEPPITLNTLLGGHLITGHVDGLGKVSEIRPRAPGKRIKIKFPLELRKFLVEKGSVAINGVSLTIASIGRDYFEVELIPTTLKETNLSELRIGQLVNLECDIIGKYVYNFISKGQY
ncbi:MAG: riboflavin synthase [Candidatus Saccharicenans sp.]|nr:MAG: riboflavin synthase [Candidatus Aminicenantes bacterium]HEK85032.1 riboflavin synthase [Candidatus Aminicenantes bacterium]